MIGRIISITLLVFGMTILCACSERDSPSDGTLEANSEEICTATIVVTRDFGSELILKQEMEIESGTSAMAALQMVANVENKYGGGFVSSINSINSEYEKANNSKKDWFLYINGVASNIGARDYILQDNDVEHWDFRDWSYQQFVPAIIGDFPQPFLSGFQGGLKPTLVVYEKPFSGEAEALVEKMKGYGVVEVEAISCDLLSDEAKGKSNLIIIASPENTLISELNEVHEKLGFYAYFEQGALILLDAEGNNYMNHTEGYGLIQATQNPWNPKGVGSGENVVWMVTGVDMNGVRNAAELLTNKNNELQDTFAVIIIDNIVIKIP